MTSPIVSHTHIQDAHSSKRTDTYQQFVTALLDEQVKDVLHRHALGVSTRDEVLTDAAGQQRVAARLTQLQQHRLGSPTVATTQQVQRTGAVTQLPLQAMQAFPLQRRQVDTNVAI